MSHPSPPPAREARQPRGTELIDVTPFGSVEPVCLEGYSEEQHLRALRRAADCAAATRARRAYIEGRAGLEEFEAALDSFFGL